MYSTEIDARHISVMCKTFKAVFPKISGIEAEGKREFAFSEKYHKGDYVNTSEEREF